MGWSCSTGGLLAQYAHRVLFISHEERDHVQNLSIDWMIILTTYVKLQVCKMLNGLIWLTIWSDIELL
jgi:hypothetical protein